MALSSHTDVESCTSLQGVILSQTLQTSVTNLEDQIHRTARTIFSRLEISEQSDRVVLEDQRQQKIALQQIRKSLDEGHVNGRTLNNRVQALEVLLREFGDRQQVQTQSLQQIQRNVTQYRETDQAPSHQPLAIEASLTQPLRRYRPQNELLPDVERRQLRPNLNPTMNPETPGDQAIALSSSRSVSLSNTISIMLTRNSCDSACGCVCHRRSQFRSPRSLNALLGSLFIGYQASPWSAQTCNNSGCQQRSKKLTYVYAFPQWFLARILVVDMAYSQSRAPELCLRVMRVRPRYTGGFSILQSALSNDDQVHRIERLLNKGEASVLDVDEFNITMLQVRSRLYIGCSVFELTWCQQRAFMVRSLGAAEFLIRYGAELHHQEDCGM